MDKGHLVETEENGLVLENIITSAVQIPGVKVDRKDFLSEIFSNEDVDMQEIFDLGPVQANITQEKLDSLANNLIWVRTSQSSLASFAMGIPGGLAMAATVPADVLQFFGMSLRLAQELSYLYGAGDLWQNGQIDNERIRNELLLYCGVMFGVSGAAAGVRVLSFRIAETALKKLPQKALTKAFWYPIVKKIAKVVGVKVTKSSVAKGVSKVIPVIGGLLSGGMNFASMMPMANNLKNTLDSVAFGYTEKDFEEDLKEIENISNDDISAKTENKDFIAQVFDGGKKLTENVFGFFAPKEPEDSQTESNDIFETLQKLSELQKAGAITDEEFDRKKEELLTKI